ncbi:MAG: hypothetical protein OSB41_01050 [Kiritimatiellae bacterium]|nr:hypothetical protein [Kiritimatiellia bacterium]
MRGKPLLQWGVFVLVWAVLVVPIWRVAQSHVHPEAAPVVASTATKAWISLHFSSPPTHVALEQDDVVLWQTSNSATQSVFEEELPLVFDAYGTEFWLKATLGENPVAVELVVEADRRAPRSQTLWVSGDVEEPLSFSWEHHHE